jgi:hypothetical protein
LMIEIKTDTSLYSIKHIFDMLNAMFIPLYISALCSKRSLLIATSYFLLLHMAAKCPQRQRYGEGQQQGVILYN